MNVPVVRLTLDGDGAAKDLKDKVEGKDWRHGFLTEVVYLKAGMQSGKPAVMFRAEMDDGTVAIIETSGAMYVMTAMGVKGAAAREGFDL